MPGHRGNLGWNKSRPAGLGPFTKLWGLPRRGMFALGSNSCIIVPVMSVSSFLRPSLYDKS